MVTYIFCWTKATINLFELLLLLNFFLFFFLFHNSIVFKDKMFFRQSFS